MSDNLSIADKLAARAKDREQALKDNGVFSGDIFPGVRSTIAVGGEEIKLIPIDQIDEPDIPQRWHYPEEEVSAMAQALLSEGDGNALAGQLQAVIIREKDNGRYEMIEGLTRLKAFKNHHLGPVIKAVIRSGVDGRSAFRMGFKANEKRNPLTDYDKGMSFAKLIERKTYDSVQSLAADLEVSDKKVYALLAFSKLPETTRSIIEQDKYRFSYNVAVQLASLNNKTESEEELNKVATKVLTGAWTGDKVAKHVASISSGKTARNNRNGTTTTLPGLGKMRYTNKRMLVDLDLSAYPPDMSEEIARKIKLVLKDYETPELPPDDGQSDGD